MFAVLGSREHDCSLHCGIAFHVWQGAAHRAIVKKTAGRRFVPAGASVLPDNSARIIIGFSSFRVTCLFSSCQMLSSYRYPKNSI